MKICVINSIEPIVNFFWNIPNRGESRIFGSICFELNVHLRRFLNLFMETGERTIECWWVKKQISAMKSGTLLDVGCGDNTRFHAWCLVRGWKVFALDIRDPVYVYPGVKFIKSDICTLPSNLTGFLRNSCDLITVISTLEHMGLGAYGDPLYENGDMLAIGIIKTIIKDKGVLLITGPFSSHPLKYWHRFYNTARLSKLSEGFAIEALEFYYRERGWRRVPTSFAEKLTSHKTGIIDDLGPRCIFCLKLRNIH